MDRSTFTYRSTIPVPAGELFAWHERAGALLRLTPPWERIEVVERIGSIHNGDRTVLRMSLGPLRRRWVAEHRDYVPGRQFCDEQVEGPFAFWRHTHRVEAAGESATTLEDQIEYALPLGAIGSLLAGRYTERSLRRVFAYRHRVTAADLIAHHKYGHRQPLRVLVSGASGLVGTALCAFLGSGGHSVTRLVRGAPREANAIGWNPDSGQLDVAAMEGFDAVVHLAGDSIAGGRWTAAKKRSILDSRVRGTRLLAERLAQTQQRPRVLVSASAVGFYGDTRDDEVDESRPSGDDFLADVCRRWESATDRAHTAGMRVVNARFGVILTPAGGALRQMLLPFRLGVGGRVGSGRQWMSWVSLDDVVYALHELLMNDSLVGPVNVVAPDAATNQRFTKALAGALHRPGVFPLPSAIARLALGEMADALLLTSQRVYPRTLLDAGFDFRWPELRPGLEHLLGRDTSR